ncbi:MAG: hypothetical protein JW943_00535 [Deltaproteobacteria bacterium]|nr:hypothetical protein [Deltaproteobacteria bacterium]
MSEYQYYEFLAIDRPLTENEMADLRGLSSRAHITPVSFTNEYQWGNFRGDPVKLMQRYFDAHVYVANWMTAVFMVRLPIEALAKETAQAMAESYVLDFTATSTHWIITWRLEESENYDRFGMEDGRGWMARLVPIRDELLRGDFRSLYIGWLVAIAGEIMDDDETEPISVTGLGNLTAAQQALVEFLEVDEDLLAGAGMGSPASQDEELSQQKVEAWIDSLTRNEVTTILKQLLDGQGQQAERILKNRFAAWRRGLRSDSGGSTRRSVSELMANAEAAENIRLEKRKREKQQREVRHQKECEAYLKNLSEDFPKAWKAIQQTVERGLGSAYDEACCALVDLSEAYKLYASNKRFQEELKKFMADHLLRKALVQRLMKAGLWKDR